MDKLIDVRIKADKMIAIQWSGDNFTDIQTFTNNACKQLDTDTIVYYRLLGNDDLAHVLEIGCYLVKTVEYWQGKDIATCGCYTESEFYAKYEVLDLN